jgi:hypothetical protein
MSSTLKFSKSVPGCDRIHHATEDDIRVLIGRLPADLWGSLRAVHFNDKSRGARTLGYVNRGRREIALCALPRRMSLTRFLTRGQSPEQFGASRGQQWSAMAIRRFMLYDVFLHELGHLQVVDGAAATIRRKFAMETKAQKFATAWCKRLWSEPFDHSDPVHNPPSRDEVTDEDFELGELTRRIEMSPQDAGLLQLLGKQFRERKRIGEAREAFERSLALDPSDPWTHLYLGDCHCIEDDHLAAIERFSDAARLMPDRSPAFWCLANAHEAVGQFEMADANYRKAVEVEPADRYARRKLREWQERSREL